MQCKLINEVKNMKKLLLTLFTVALFILSFTSIGFAAQKSEVTYKKDLIKDLKVLQERAEKGISDKKPDFIKNFKATMEDNKTGEKVDLNVKETTQLYQVSKDVQGNTIESYAVTSFVSDDSKKSTSYLSDGGVKAYSTIYYNIKYDNNKNTHIGLVGTDGGWTIVDSFYTLSNRNVSLVQSGRNNINWTNVNLTAGPYYPSSNSFSYSVFWDGQNQVVWANDPQWPYRVGMTSKVSCFNIKLGYTTTLSLYNNY